MAIKITSNLGIKKVSPQRHQFNLDEFDELVNGQAESFEIDNVWIVYSDNRKNKVANQIATLMFGVPLYGDVLIVPPQQMPPEWEIENMPDIYDITADDFDNSFLYSIEKSLNYMRKNEMLDLKEEWMYKPGTIEPNDELTLLFTSAFEFLNENKFKQLNDNILYEDEYIVLKSKSIEDSLTFLNQLLEYFVEIEEYEKCAVLKKVIDKHSKPKKTRRKKHVDVD